MPLGGHFYTAANSTALVNIVGAYRLRQYDKNGVFVGDQDFKRPPIKALTSVVYPLYFEEGVATSFKLNHAATLVVPAVSERIYTEYQLSNINVHSVMNSTEIQAEALNTNYALIVVVREDTRDPYQKTTTQPETILSSFGINDVIQNTVLINNTMPYEGLMSSFDVTSIEIIEQD